MFPKVNEQSKKSVISLYSGGLDSLVVTHLYHVLGYDVTLVHIDYGQQAEELESRLTEEYANYIGAKVLNFDLKDTFLSIVSQLNKNMAEVSRLWDSSAQGEGEKEAETSLSYVPFRNTLFLTIAGMVAEQLDVKYVTYGSNLTETMGYPDNGEPFLRAMDQVMKVGSNKKDINLRAPLFTLTKSRLIELGALIGAPFHLSDSCYFPKDGKACGRCGSCYLRMRAFKRAGIIDPNTSHVKDFDWGNSQNYKATNTPDMGEVYNWLERFLINLELDYEGN